LFHAWAKVVKRPASMEMIENEIAKFETQSTYGRALACSQVRLSDARLHHDVSTLVTHYPS
jgi:hypothetical protein